MSKLCAGMVALSCAAHPAFASQVTTDPFCTEQILLGSKSEYMSESNPWSIAAGDLDLDGDIDLAAANAQSGSVSVYFNNGDGTFASQIVYSVGDTPVSIAIGHINSDSAPDIVTANADSNDISILLNSGTGSFGPETRRSVGNEPRAVELARVNADALDDIIVANAADNTVMILVNSAFGGFTPQLFTVHDNPVDLATADQNNDGFIDHIITANALSDDVSILSRAGNGSFQPEIRRSVGFVPMGVETGDFNNDGIVDIVTTNSDGDDISIVYGSASAGGFSMMDIRFPVGNHPRSVAVRDLDGDSRPDLVVSNAGSDDISILRADPNGAFFPEQRQGSGSEPGGLVVASLDDDATPDIALTLTQDDAISVFGNATLQITYWTGFDEDFSSTSAWSGGIPPSLDAPDVGVFDSTIFPFGTSGPVPVFLSNDTIFRALGHANEHIELDMNGRNLSLVGLDAPFGAIGLELGIVQCSGSDFLPDMPPMLSLLNQGSTPSTFSTARATVGRSGPASLLVGLDSAPVELSINRDFTIGQGGTGSVQIAPGAQGSQIRYGGAEDESFTIGAASDGFIHIPNGCLFSQARVTDLIIGRDPGVTGVAAFDAPIGTGPCDFSWTHSGKRMIVGESGTGLINIANGAVVFTDLDEPIVLAQEPGSAAQIFINGSGSSWQAPFSLIQGGEGETIIDIRNGAVLSTGVGLAASRTTTIQGDGSILFSSSGAALFNTGTITPTPPSAGGLPVATFSVAGNLSLTDNPSDPTRTGRVLIDITSPTGILQGDQIAVDGQADLRGGALIVRDQGFINPPAGTKVGIVTAQSPIAPTPFQAALLPRLPGDRFFTVVYDGASGSSFTLGSPGKVELESQLYSPTSITTPSPYDPGVVPDGAALGDLDGDGFDDFALVVPDETNPTTDPGEIRILINAQTTEPPASWPGFTGGTITLATEANPTDVAIGDLDGINGNDIAVSTASDDSVEIFLNDGMGGFTSAGSWVFNDQTACVAIGDLDGDGFPDVAAGGDDFGAMSGDPGVVTVRLNNGVTASTWNGLNNTSQDFEVGERPVDLLMVDLDEEKDLDLVSADYVSSTLSILENQGTSMGSWSGFANAASIDVGDGPVGLFASDLDEEKDLDLVSINQDGDSISIIIHDDPAAASLGDRFAPSTDLTIGTAPSFGAVWDINNDGDPDPAIVVTDDNSSERVVRLLRNLVVENDAAGTPGLTFQIDSDIASGDVPILVRSGIIDSGSGDDLAIVTDPPSPLPNESGTQMGGLMYSAPIESCSADLDRNGLVDFFDLSMFLNKRIDWDESTAFDFFDLSMYLQAFNAECP